MRKRRNALLARPPAGFHYLTRQRVSPKLYEGVHTTGDFEIAAAYAIGTDSYVSRAQKSYPVVLELDVGGLEFKPDVDATIQAESAFTALEAEQVLREIKRGKTPEEIAEDYGAFGTESECTVGSDPSCFIFEDSQHYNAVGAILAFYGGGAEANARVVEWASTGRYDERVLVHLVNQRRYLVDFKLDRLMQVIAFKPWWNAVFNPSDTDEEQEEISGIERAGFEVYTLDDLPITIREEQVLYQSKRKPKDTQYHGTASVLAQTAFPEIELPVDPPYPTRDPNDEDDEDA